MTPTVQFNRPSDADLVRLLREAGDTINEETSQPHMRGEAAARLAQRDTLWNAAEALEATPLPISEWRNDQQLARQLCALLQDFAGENIASGPIGIVSGEGAVETLVRLLEELRLHRNDALAQKMAP